MIVDYSFFEVRIMSDHLDGSKTTTNMRRKRAEFRVRFLTLAAVRILSVLRTLRSTLKHITRTKNKSLHVMSSASWNRLYYFGGNDRG